MAQTVLRLDGDKALDTAEILCSRLRELGYAATAQGTEVCLDASGNKIPGDFSLLPQDTPAFSAEKILDVLEAAGLIHLAQASFSPEEDAALQDRLRRLGYIE